LKSHEGWNIFCAERRPTLSTEHKTDPPRKRPTLRPLGAITESGRWVPLNSGRYSPALQAIDSTELEALVDEREDLREQLKNVKELSSRLIDRVDAQDQRISGLESELKKKEQLIHDLEAEAAQLIAHASNREEHVKILKGELRELEATTEDLVAHAAKREERISQLEKFLEMISDSERR
jgi:DNA repair exonuclease SbcCD ATPase subunit